RRDACPTPGAVLSVKAFSWFLFLRIQVDSRALQYEPESYSVDLHRVARSGRVDWLFEGRQQGFIDYVDHFSGPADPHGPSFVHPHGKEKHGRYHHGRVADRFCDSLGEDEEVYAQRSYADGDYRGLGIEALGLSIGLRPRPRRRNS